jgi:hypothetical protein
VENCPNCHSALRHDGLCGCEWRADPPAPVRASTMTLSTPWGLRRRRRSIARAAVAEARGSSSGAGGDSGLVPQRTSGDLDGVEGMHRCSACRNAMSILWP